MYNLEDVIYLAGFLDGEGCISIFRLKTSKGANRAFGLLLQVTNTNESVMQWLHTTFGGSTYRTGPTRPRCAAQWKWHVCGETAEAVIKAVHPYLKIKKPEAIIALKFMISKRQSSQGRKPLPDSLIAERESLYQELKKAKRAYKDYTA